MKKVWKCVPDLPLSSPSPQTSTTTSSQNIWQHLEKRNTSHLLDLSFYYNHRHCHHRHCCHYRHCHNGEYCDSTWERERPPTCWTWSRRQSWMNRIWWYLDVIEMTCQIIINKHYQDRLFIRWWATNYCQMANNATNFFLPSEEALEALGQEGRRALLQDKSSQ